MVDGPAADIQLMLGTSPNAAIPVGLRRKAYDEDEVNGAKKHAAGIVFVSPEGRILLLRRSDKEENFAGHWALPGGGVEEGETPEEGAAREAREEMGADVDPASFRKLHKTITPTGTAYHTFARPVAKEFKPKLNDEHTAHKWADLGMLPRPMHPAVERMLQSKIGLADDMSPKDWQGLRDGFLKWLSEEEWEPEHMGTDSRQRMALDRKSARYFDDEGRLHVTETNICKASVNPYKGSEIPDWEKLGLDGEKIYQLFRPPEELEKATPTSNGIQLMRIHKPVDAEDHLPYDVAGSVGTSARWEDPFVKNAITIWPADDIDLIESEKKFELSPGYRYDPVIESGSFNGAPYEIKMTNIVFNHIAIVEEGRQGQDVVVADGLLDLQWAMIERAILAMGRKRRAYR
jgi:8-oxo-dGTP pyrophosphatase MutT (NUDIX family)